MDGHENFIIPRIQTSIATHLLRETDALILVRSNLKIKNPRILSFGCSVGDELATLKILFPDAHIYGCDIDGFALKKAQETVGDMATVFYSSAENIVANGPYDLICAFSSMCINPFPGLAKFLTAFPFSLFEDLLGMLTAQISTGGILCLRNTSYPFCATSVAGSYDIIRTDSFLNNGFVSMVHPSGEMALTQVPVKSGSLFRIGNVDGLTDWSLMDSVYRKRGMGHDGPTIEDQSPSWSLPPVEFTETARWSRSNLDYWEGEDAADLLETRTNFRCLQSKEKPDMVYVERESLRTSLVTRQLLHLNRRGSWH